MGAASELLVAADLLLRGWDVFRAVSGACPCDLIIMRGSVLRRVEVKTAVATAAGTFPAFPGGIYSDRHDVLALVSDGRIEYRPENF